MKQSVAFVLLFVAAAASAEAPPYTITVGGSARIVVKADRGQFTVGVSTRATTVTSALRTNNDKMQRVIAALKSHGAAENEISTSSFSITQPFENGRHVIGIYEVQNSVTVTRSAVASISDLLQIAIDAGANQAWNVRFFLAEPGPVRDRALAAAYKDARVRAQKLASAAGKSVGDLLTITTEQFPRFPLLDGTGQEAMTGLGPAPPLQAGMQSVEASVVAQFELK